MNSTCNSTINLQLNMTKTFKVVSVSKNTNAFGLTGIILLAADGEAFEAASYCMGSFALSVGEMVTLAVSNPDAQDRTDKYQWVSTAGRTFEIPRALPKPSVQMMREAFPEVWATPQSGDPLFIARRTQPTVTAEEAREQRERVNAAVAPTKLRAEPPAAVTFRVTDFPVMCVDPKADSEILAAKGRRVMLRRNQRAGEFSLFVAEAGVLTAGYVVGIERTE